ncbi:MAG: hypothetical protein AAFW73_02430 [Bacteroidota bacterium]
MIIASLIAFVSSVLIFGLPSKRNFDHLIGHHLIWRSRWFRWSIVLHGLLAVGVLWILQIWDLTISFGGQPAAFQDSPWRYGLFAGFFYPSVIYSLIGALSATGVATPEDGKPIKSSMDFYVSLLGHYIEGDIYALTKKTVRRTRREFDRLEDYEIYDFLRALFLRIDSEDAGAAAEIISELKAMQEQLGRSEEEAIAEIKGSAIEKILERYLLKHGHRRYRIDMMAVRTELRNRQREEENDLEALAEKLD